MAQENFAATSSLQYPAHHHRKLVLLSLPQTFRRPYSALPRIQMHCRTALNYSFNALMCMTLGDQALVLGERDCLLDCDFCACMRYKWAGLKTVNPFSTELKHRRRMGMHTDNELNSSGMRMVAIHYCIIPTSVWILHSSWQSYVSNYVHVHCSNVQVLVTINTPCIPGWM